MDGAATVAVVGTGAMGGRIAARLLDAGHPVVVWNRTRERLRPLCERGAASAATPAEAARDADVLITMVADPAALATVSEAPDGIATGAGARLTVIEMSTVGPAAVARLRGALPDATGLLDAPVLGSRSEAESGTLRIFAGGPEPLVGRWTPLLERLGEVLPAGPLGAGSAAKLVANATLVGVTGLLGESLALADELGFDRDVAFAVLAATPLGAQAERRRAAVESGDFPARFPLALARKDADLIRDAAGGRDLRLVEAAARWLREAEAAGWGDRDYAALVAWIAGCGRVGPAAPG